MTETNLSSSHLLWLEMEAMWCVEGNPLDPKKDVPFAVLGDVQRTLIRLAEPEIEDK